MGILQNSNAIPVIAGYEVDYSARFDSASASYMNRTPSTNGNRKTYTFSTWLKRGSTGANHTFFGATSGKESVFRFGSDDELAGWEWSGSFLYQVKSANSIVTDTTDWHHVVLRVDTTQATANNRIRIYLDGSLLSLSTNDQPSQNYETNVNSTAYPTYVGWSGYSSQYFNGKLAETVLIDGLSLGPDSFGVTSGSDWVPIDVSGLTFGTNGFYLEYGTAAALGDDTSGNGNDLSVSNMGTDHQETDTPTS